MESRGDKRGVGGYPNLYIKRGLVLGDKRANIKCLAFRSLCTTPKECK
jgi:hypothetical protein